LREDGGTPGFLQAIRTALAINLKEEMKTVMIKAREKELLEIAFEGLKKIPEIKILADQHENRLGIISFYHPNIHYNLIVKLLSDRYGIQVRGGCACAGTYGHFLLKVSHERSKEITDKITHGDLSEKPGWVRLSLHPTLTNNELLFVVQAIGEIVKNYKEWQQDYRYLKNKNEYVHKNDQGTVKSEIEAWFDLS